MGLFGSSNSKEKLEKKYQKLMEESFKLSSKDRAASDQKRAEAEAIMDQIEKLKNE
jgi:hypothetical protein